MAEFVADFDTAHCGVIHDAQLDTYGRWLATASADGNVRVWDVVKPGSPKLLANLGGHAGPVYQVAWASPEAGVLLASAGADGCLLIWGRCAEGGRWHVVHRHALKHHNHAVRAVAWAPPEHGTILACACSEGTVSVIKHIGAVTINEMEVEHKWQDHRFDAHQHEACAVSWASAPAGLGLGASLGVTSARLEGAQLATAGADGVKVWRWDSQRSSFVKDPMKQLEDASARDVAWKPWDGVTEMIASVAGKEVLIWNRVDSAPWQVAHSVSFGQDVWKISWAETGNMLLVSYGVDEERTALVKQRLDKEWDVMDVAEAPAGAALDIGNSAVATFSDGLHSDLACGVGGG
eukprot:TRINITY_DN61277_c0_g1_i1.p1 TRINITY_DN61277_c0_g1~~TRINITY_DN61277_c0_g1_i1.p1  ORF type:complete len:349 (+),score=50.88 TRINITY_DN61277_c0_g1_i1:70-1116(+)